MLTGELRNQIDAIWNDFWSGGLSNPLRQDRLKKAPLFRTFAIVPTIKPTFTSVYAQTEIE
jgi:hypothetical protein